MYRDVPRSRGWKVAWYSRLCAALRRMSKLGYLRCLILVNTVPNLFILFFEFPVVSFVSTLLE